MFKKLIWFFYLFRLIKSKIILHCNNKFYFPTFCDPQKLAYRYALGLADADRIIRGNINLCSLLKKTQEPGYCLAFGDWNEIDW